MNVQAIIIATVVVAVVGIVIGIILGIAGEKFKVEIDPREEAVLDALPGNNCGGCGLPAVPVWLLRLRKARLRWDPARWAALRWAKIGAIMGVEAGEAVRMVAYVKCAGTCDQAGVDYNYIGEKSCHMVKQISNGGPKSCNHGCLGFGECVEACPFDAIPYCGWGGSCRQRELQGLQQVYQGPARRT